MVFVLEQSISKLSINERYLTTDQLDRCHGTWVYRVVWYMGRVDIYTQSIWYVHGDGDGYVNALFVTY